MKYKVLIQAILDDTISTDHPKKALDMVKYMDFNRCKVKDISLIEEKEWDTYERTLMDNRIVSDEEITKYKQELVKALKDLDVKKFKKFCIKYYEKGYLEHQPPADPELLEISMYKLAYSCHSLPDRTRMKAAAWLIAHGMHLEYF